MNPRRLRHLRRARHASFVDNDLFVDGARNQQGTRDTMQESQTLNARKSDRRQKRSCAVVALDFDSQLSIEFVNGHANRWHVVAAH